MNHNIPLLSALLCCALVGGAVRADVPRTRSVASVGAPSLTAAADVEITRDWLIVVPDPEPSGVQRWIRVAAEEIRDDLKEAMGLDLPVVVKSKAKKGPAIFLGAEFAKAAGFAFDDFTWYDNAYGERGGSLYLFGNDFPGRTERNLDWQRCVLPTVKATTRFLEDCLGVRFLMFGRTGTEVPRRDRVAVTGGTLSVQRPRMIFGACTGGTSAPRNVLYHFANNWYGSGAFKSYGGHSYPSACPAKTHFADHPEYFALIQGRRFFPGSGCHPHLCLSNPAVQDLIYAELLRQFDAGAKVCQLAQEDGFRPCECANCRKLFGVAPDDWGEKLWILHRNLAERALKDRPGRIVHLLAYGDNRNPPKTFRAFPPNVMVELCSYSEEMFRKWREVDVPQGFTVYTYFWGSYISCGFVPRRSLAYLARFARLFAANNVRGVFRCGGCEDLNLCEGPAYYVFNRMVEDPEADPQAIRAEWIRAAFGPAAPQMMRFYREQDKCAALFDAVQEHVPCESQPLPLQIVEMMMPPESLRLREEALARAETTPNLSAKQRLRLLAARREFDVYAALGRIALLYPAYRLNPTQANFDLLAAEVERRNAALGRIYGDGETPRPLDGWPELQFFRNEPRATAARNGRYIDAPLAWDIAFLKEKGVLPGKSRKTATAARARTKPSGTDFSRGDWASVPWNDLGGIQLETPNVTGRFKALYDDENVYLAVETELGDGVATKAAGPDNHRACIEESVDLLFAPKPDVCYHLIYNPVPDSWCDQALGLIDDPLHPLYGKFDSLWTGRWTTESSRANGCWRSLVTLPHATFGVAAPRPGDMWRLNVGRCADMTKGRSALVRLALWSPNLESRSFLAPEAMGELKFK